MMTLCASQTKMDSFTLTHCSNEKRSKLHGDTWIRRLMRSVSSMVEPCFRMETDDTGEFVIELELCHAPQHQIIWRQFEVGTPREKLQDKLV